MGLWRDLACIVLAALLGCAAAEKQPELAPADAAPRDFPEGPGCGSGLMEQYEKRPLAQADADFFTSADWTPAKVPEGCTGEREAPQPLLEARAQYPMAAAMPALHACMAQHDTPWLTLAMEIDAATGCVAAVMAVSEPRNAALDTCVANAAVSARFEPSNAPEHTTFRIHWEPGDERAPPSLSAPQQLVPVHSRCPTPLGPPRGEPPTRDEVLAAHKDASAALESCLDIWDHRPGQSIAFNVHGPTGHVVAAALVQEQRSHQIDACVAAALATTCFVPFEVPQATHPYWSTRVPLELPPEPKAPVTRCTAERTSMNERPTARELAEAFALVRAGVQRCMASHGVQEPLYLEVNVLGATGRVANATLEATPVDAPLHAPLHACIEKALEHWCVAPFFTPDASEPYLNLRLPFIPAGYGYRAKER